MLLWVMNLGFAGGGVITGVANWSSDYNLLLDIVD